MVYAGIDVGTLWTKALVLEDNRIVGWGSSLTGESCDHAARQTLGRALASCGASIDDVSVAVATGEGKADVTFTHDQATDIVCIARGIHFLLPDARAVIDMGGESTVAVKLDEKGQIVEYVRNDKCAAGTGIFLDAMGKVMGVGVEDMGPLSLKSTAEASITSMCVVFAESEVVSQVHRRVPKEDIVKGIHRSIATRIFGLASRLELNGGTVAIGGLARNQGIISCLEEMIKRKLTVPENPQLVSALGAAIVASEKGAER